VGKHGTWITNGIQGHTLTLNAIGGISNRLVAPSPTSFDLRLGT
jgi:hypothetical protein